MSRWLALVLVVSCADQRFELISSLTVDAGTVDAGRELEDAGCTDFSFDTGKRFTRVALAVSSRGPIVFGVSTGLESLVLRDGGAVSTTLVTPVADSTISAVNGPRGVAVAFHSGAPSLALIDDDGALREPATSMLAPREGANAPWGLRVTADAQRYLVQYRTLGAQVAYTSTTDGPVVVIGASGEVDGVLDGESVRLIYEAGGETRTWHGTLDGGVLSQRTVSPTTLGGRPFACPDVSLFSRREDAGLSIDAVGSTQPFTVLPNATRIVRGVCASGSVLTLLVSGQTAFVKRVHADGRIVDALSETVPVLDDAAMTVDAQSVWLLTAPRFETAKLIRRCMTP